MTTGDVRVTLDIGAFARAFYQLVIATPAMAEAVAAASESYTKLGNAAARVQRRERERRLRHQIKSILKDQFQGPSRPRRAISFDGRF